MDQRQRVVEDPTAPHPHQQKSDACCHIQHRGPGTHEEERTEEELPSPQDDGEERTEEELPSPQDDGEVLELTKRRGRRKSCLLLAIAKVGEEPLQHMAGRTAATTTAVLRRDSFPLSTSSTSRSGNTRSSSTRSSSTVDGS